MNGRVVFRKREVAGMTNEQLAALAQQPENEELVPALGESKAGALVESQTSL